MRTLMTSVLLLAVSLGAAWGREKGDYLSEDETEQLREAQEPSQRIAKYLSFAQDRLMRFDDYRNRQPSPDYDIPGYLDTQLDQYIRITDALKDCIEDHFDRHDDMRAGLKKVLEMGPRQLDQLRHIEQSSDAYSAGYRKSLGDAIDDFTDALDGAAKALSEQSKLFGELKREEKADAQTVRDREKEEKKRSKEEGKLRKKEHEKGPPTDKDED
jgi:hypothetical protein